MPGKETTRITNGERTGRLYRAGLRGLVMAIPAAWARARGLSPGSEVRLRFGRVLVVTPIREAPARFEPSGAGGADGPGKPHQ